MKRTVLAIMTLLAVMPAVAATAQEATTSLKSEKDKLSYAMGMDLAGQLKANGVDLDPAIFAKGMRDLFAGKTLLTDSEAKAIIAALQKTMFVKRTSELQVAGAKNKKDGEEFLAANKKKPGVVTLPSGVQYKVITAGKGPKPTPDQTVVCNYRGRLHRREGVRQLVQARPAGDVPGEGRDQGLDGSLAVDAGRLQVAGVHSAGPRLRRAWLGSRYRSERDADLRNRARRHQVGRRYPPSLLRSYGETSPR